MPDGAGQLLQCPGDLVIRSVVEYRMTNLFCMATFSPVAVFSSRTPFCIAVAVKPIAKFRREQNTRAAQSRSNRADRTLQVHRGGLFVACVLEIAQGTDGLRGMRAEASAPQGGHARWSPLRSKSASGSMPNSSGRSAASAGAGRAISGSFSSFFSQHIAGDAVEKRAQGPSPRVELFSMLHQHQENFLRHVLGGRYAAGHLQREAVDRAMKTCW